MASSACLTCPTGTYALPASHICVQCAHGQYSNAGSASSSDCVPAHRVVFTLQLAGDIDVSQIQSMKNDLEGSIASKLGIDRTLVKLSILDARRHLLALTLAIQVLAPSKDEAEAFANQSAQVQEATQEVAREANIDLDVTVTSELFEPIAEPSPPSPPSPPATPSSPPAASPSSPPSSTTSATKDSDDGAEVSAGGFQKDTRDEPQGSGPPVAVIAGVAGPSMSDSNLVFELE